MSNVNETVKDKPTQEERQQLGSLEAQAWTIIPPGGTPMSLNDYAANANQGDQDEEDDPAYEEYKKFAAEENAPRPMKADR